MLSPLTAPERIALSLVAYLVLCVLLALAVAWVDRWQQHNDPNDFDDPDDVDDEPTRVDLECQRAAVTPSEPPPAVQAVPTYVATDDDELAPPVCGNCRAFLSITPGGSCWCCSAPLLGKETA